MSSLDKPVEASKYASPTPTFTGVLSSSSTPVPAPSSSTTTKVSSHAADTVVIIDLPVNESSGIMFDGAPPRVTGVTRDIASLKPGQSVTGYFFSSLLLPDLEIYSVLDRQRLLEILQANQHLPRKLVLSVQAPHVSQHGCHYKHLLPVAQDLGIEFGGFPAAVVSLKPESPMLGKLNPGQSVYVVKVPGQPDLMMQSGGFTGARVQEHLQKYWAVPGKQIVVTDNSTVLHDPTSDAGFECQCVVL